MNRTNVEVARLICEEVWGKGKAELVDELYAENYVDLNPVPCIPANREGLKMQLGIYHQAFPNLGVEVEETVVDGDKIVVRYTIRGTHGGELMGIPATGKTCQIAGISMIRLANGKVVEEFSLADMMTLFQQLGLAPEMA